MTRAMADWQATIALRPGGLQRVSWGNVGRARAGDHLGEAIGQTALQSVARQTRGRFSNNVSGATKNPVLACADPRLVRVAPA